MNNKKCQKVIDKEDVFICLGMFKEANKTYPLPESLCVANSKLCRVCTKEKIKLYSDIMIDKHKVDLGLLSIEDSKAHMVIKREEKKDYDISIFSELQKLEKVNILLPKIQKLTISCIIHSFNNEKNIDQIYNGLKKLDINEIIICEDGSLDGSKEKWKKYSQKDKRIKIIYSNDIHELRCFDNAIKKSSSDVCCLFQGDDIIPDDKGFWFNQGKELLESVQDLVVLGGFSTLNIHKIVSEKKFIREDHRAKNIFDISNLSINKIPFAYVMGVVVGPYFIRKTSYIDFGGFELIHKIGKPSIFHDLLFCLKVWDNNLKVGIYNTVFKKKCGSCKRIETDEEYKKDFNEASSIDVKYIYSNYSNKQIDKIKNDVIKSNLTLRTNNKVQKIIKKEEQNFESKISLKDKIKGIKGAFLRAKNKKDGIKTIWADEKEIIERQVCCTTCTDGGTCPYCGCQIKKSWFLPLGKSNLTTEGCPNPNTYPHLKKFPPKNYWKVCEEKTSVIIAAKNEKYLNKTIKNLLETATGDIEILVGLDGINYDVIKDDNITVLYENKHIGRRKISNKLSRLATGKYLFETDAHCIMNYGWDTKLKCVCDGNTIVGCTIDSIDEEKWEPNNNKWIGGKITNDLKWEWNLENTNNLGKVKEVNSFNSCAWMIRKDYFEKLERHDEDLGEWGGENIEFTTKSVLNEGKIIIRTDVVCSHLFRSEYPYKIKGIGYENIVEKIKKYTKKI